MTASTGDTGDLFTITILLFVLQYLLASSSAASIGAAVLSIVFATGLIYWFRTKNDNEKDQKKEMSGKSTSSSSSSSTSTSTKAAPLHYAWNDKTASRSAELVAAGVDTSPKPVASSSPIESGVTSKGGSIWNSAGTYEEKDATTRGLSLLRERLLASSCLLCNKTFNIRLVRIGKAEGNVLRVFARGKARLGFELSISVDYEVVAVGEEESSSGIKSRGIIQFDDVADTNSDVFDKMTVSESSSTSSSSSSVLKAALKSREMEEFFRREIKSWANSVLENN